MYTKLAEDRPDVIADRVRRNEQLFAKRSMTSCRITDTAAAPPAENSIAARLSNKSFEASPSITDAGYGHESNQRYTSWSPPW